MSDAQNEMLQSIKAQHELYCSQLNDAKVNCQQLLGAVFACEALIKNLENATAGKRCGETEKTVGKTAGKDSLKKVK